MAVVVVVVVVAVAVVVGDFEGTEADMIPVRKGDIVRIFQVMPEGWSFAQNLTTKSSNGWVPSWIVRSKEDEISDAVAAVAPQPEPAPQPTVCLCVSVCASLSLSLSLFVCVNVCACLFKGSTICAWMRMARWGIPGISQYLAVIGTGTILATCGCLTKASAALYPGPVSHLFVSPVSRALSADIAS